MLKQLPAWVRWSVLAVVLWGVWLFVVMPIFARRIESCDQQHRGTDRQCAELQMRLKQAPALVSQSDSCCVQLMNHLAALTQSDSIVNLVARLCGDGTRLGLRSVRAEPDLASLLHRSAGWETPSTGIHLDTLVVALTGAGRFLDIGAWLDGVEARPDFRTWQSCRWTAGDDPAGTVFEGHVMLIVASGQVAADIR